MSAQAKTVLCIGETMAMVTPLAAEPVVTARDFRVETGGAESNVAARLAGMGLRASWLSRLGADPLGDRIENDLVARGVEVRAERDAEHLTGLYVKDPGNGVFYYRAASAAAHAGPSLLDAVDWDDVEIVHVSGITPALSASCAELIDEVFIRANAAAVPVSFDVNHRAALWTEGEAPRVLLALARRADIVFVGLDEAEGLWGTETDDAVRELIGTRGVLVVKDGAVGATAYLGEERVFVPSIRVEVVEAVGAGDAFASGFLAGTLEGLAVEQRLARGHRCAADALSSTSDI